MPDATNPTPVPPAPPAATVREDLTTVPHPVADSPTYATVTTPTTDTAGEVEQLRAENAELRRLLADRNIARPVIGAPSFGMSEGTRLELLATGRAEDPYTRKSLTRDDLDSDGQAPAKPAAKRGRRTPAKS